MHFKYFILNGLFQNWVGGAMINGQKRMQIPGCISGNNTFGLVGDGAAEGEIRHFSQGFRPQAGHVTADYEIPFAVRVRKSREDSSQRSAVLHAVRNDGEAQVCVPLGGTNDGDVSGDLLKNSRRPFQQCHSIHRQQSFVGSHPGTSASGQNEGFQRRVSVASAAVHSQPHAKIVPSADSLYKMNRSEKNKIVYICLLAAVYFAANAMLSSPMLAADRPVVSTLLAATQASQGKVSVVRVDRRTGKLIRSLNGFSFPGPLTSASQPVKPAPQPIQRIVEERARTHGVDPLLVESVIQVESNFNPRAISSKGAEGLMQLMPATARSLGVANSFDPAQNIDAGVRYLKYLQSLYQDDRLVLAAYNAGPKAVEKYREVPPYAETEQYVNRVGMRYRAATQEKNAKSAATANSATVIPEAKVPEPIIQPEPRLEQFVDENGRLYLRTLE